MISRLIDELNKSADEWNGSNMFELAHMCRDAADTIWQLRDDLQRANAENAKLREQLEYALQTSRARLETIDRLKAENEKLREHIADLWEFGFSKNAGANSIKEYLRKVDELRDRTYELLGAAK